jgi:putative FmdB family regulatory protein
MPIYEYRCSSCGFQKEHLQKVNDARLTVCPQCGQATYQKMLTSAGFHLKGSGWYATDFKGGSAPAAAKTDGDAKEGGAKEGGADKPAAPGTDKSNTSPAPTSTPASTPASTVAARPEAS